MNSTHFDAIVIGSGMGGLTVARLLSLVYGKKVLVLERHFKAGGMTHTFKRPGGYHWDVGLHYVGDVGQGSDLGKLFGLLTDGNLVWQQMLDPIERFVFPDFEFALRSGEKNFRADLIAKFPKEASAIRRYFKDIRKAASWALVASTAGILPSWIRTPLSLVMGKRRTLASMTTQDYLESRFEDPKLRAVLAAQWGDYGLPPSESSFLIHSTIVAHYLNGAFYPVGSSEMIAKHIINALKAQGSDVHIDSEVTEIIVEKDKACGVRVRLHRPTSPKAAHDHVMVEYRAPLIISDAGARQTFLKLLPTSVDVPFRDELLAVQPGYSHVTLYLGLKESPAKLGIQGENLWIYDNFDHDDVHRRRNDLATGVASSCFLSFPSLKDIAAKAHTAEIVAPIDFNVFARWQNQDWGRRDEEYQALKARISEALLEFVERRLPGFREMIAYSELSTPLSNVTFTAHPGGEIYGIPATPDRLRYSWLNAKTFLPGLYLTGADAASHGIAGAMMGGVAATAAIEGPSAFMKVFSRANRS